MVGLLNHKDQKQTRDIIELARYPKKMGLTQCNIEQIIHRELGLKCLSFSNTPFYLLLLVFHCIYISQGSVATQLRYGGILNKCFICLKNVSVKFFENRLIIGKDMDNIKCDNFLRHSGDTTLQCFNTVFVGCWKRRLDRS